ncbi:hypothetical protein GCM10007079_22140 [Nocardiopsis terrae]|nr:hypothetical protein GCM10007079_22140 [Nocardiopsis terrae]
MSEAVAYRVGAETLTVPGQASCSWEQPKAIGGRTRSPGCASARTRARVEAMTVSVVSGRCGPCCSRLPTGSRATRATGAPSSSLVLLGRGSEKSMGTSCRVAPPRTRPGGRGAQDLAFAAGERPGPTGQGLTGESG